MMEDLISRLKSHFENASIKRDNHETDNTYGIPAERKQFTKCWVLKHWDLFETVTDSELIAETNLLQPNLKTSNEVSNESCDAGKLDREKKFLGINCKKVFSSDKGFNKKEVKPLGETDSGFPGTAIETKCPGGPQCDSCQSLLKSLCRGCHYKVQSQTQCYFFSAFKKNKSKKMQNKQTQLEQLCTDCKDIVETEHGNIFCKSAESVPNLPKSSHRFKPSHSIPNLPKWSRQRKNLLSKRKKSNISRKHEKKNYINVSKVDRVKEPHQSRTRKTRNRFTSCQHDGSSMERVCGHNFGDNVMYCRPSIYSSPFKGKSKSIKTFVNTYNASTQSRSKGNRKDGISPNIDPCPQMIPNCSPILGDKTKGRLSCLKRLCPCDAACDFCEDLKFNWRLLTTLPKNWGTLLRDKHESEGFSSHR